VNEPATSEDQALLAVLTALEVADAEAGAPAAHGLHGAPSALAGDDEVTTETLTRIYREVVGLVPFAQPPMSPHRKVKRNLMALIADAAPAAESVPPAAVAAVAAAVTPAATGDGAAVSPAPVPAPAPAPAPVLAHAVRSRGRRGAWVGLGLAAALILALGGTCGWLYQGLAAQDETIARLGRERDQERERTNQLEGELSRLTSEVGNMRSNVAVITSPAVEVCALRPVATAAAAGMPDMAAVHGILFVAADHQHWYMSLHGLKPAGGGKVYQLWFVGDQGPVSGGTFGGAAAGAPWDVGAEHMPAGTREIKITLEPNAGATAPAGPEVMRNADPLRIL
jgi:hypothetical protein